MQESPKPSPLGELFHLRSDQEHADVIDRDIRDNVRVAGTNLWVLFFAILIASIGLNVNSTAVIIGAMLISPLMGPIVGIGYGAGVSDMKLIRLAARNMLVFIVISLITSALYFLLTPLKEAQSELLARTQPSLWDVLIAFFGGSAGIVALTRKEISNVIPGVAIATALMPPLCTAGYALVHGNWEYFSGAFYLFTINCVFIAFSTLLFVKLMKLPRRGVVSDAMLRVHRAVIVLVVTAVMVPSGFLAVGMVRKEVFDTRVNNALRRLQQEEGLLVLRSSIDAKLKQVRLIVSGTGDTEAVRQSLAGRLKAAGADAADIQVSYAGGSSADWEAFRREAAGSDTRAADLQQRLQQQQEYIDTLLAAEQKRRQAADTEATVLRELRAQYPEAVRISIGSSTDWQNHAQAASAASAPSDARPAAVRFVRLTLPQPLSDNEQGRLNAWLKERTGTAFRLETDTAPSEKGKP